MPELHEIVAQHAQILRENDQRWEDQRDVNQQHSAAIQELKDGQARVLELIGEVPTRAELDRKFYEQRAHFDGAINGLLRDAIKATPAEAADRQVQATRAGNVWLAVAAVAAVCGLVVSLLVAAVTVSARSEQQQHIAAQQ